MTHDLAPGFRRNRFIGRRLAASSVLLMVLAGCGSEPTPEQMQEALDTLVSTSDRVADDIEALGAPSSINGQVEAALTTLSKRRADAARSTDPLDGLSPAERPRESSCTFLRHRRGEPSAERQ